jgi:hypothetical protein
MAWLVDEYIRNIVGMMLTGKVKNLGEKLSQCHFVHYRAYMDWHEIEQSTLFFKYCIFTVINSH